MNTIKKLRIRKGLSQEELALKSGLSLRTIQRMENNETKPHGDSLRKIFNILNTYPDINLTGTDENKTEIDTPSFKDILGQYDWIFTGIVSLLTVVAGFLSIIGYGLLKNICFLCIITLSFTTVYSIAKRGFKSYRRHFIISLSSILIYLLFIVGMTLPGKSIRVTTENGVRTRIETNYITGTSDTTIIKKGNIR